MHENIFAGVLHKRIRVLLADVPGQLMVKISASNHFMQRVAARSDQGMSAMIFEIAEIVAANYPLILYYTALDILPPERGQLEHPKYGIRGNVIDGAFVLQTFFIKGVD